MTKIAFIFSIFLLAPVSAQAVNGSWEGSGSCFISHSQGIQSACDYRIRMQQERNSLNIHHCVVWHQEWGDGYECYNRNFIIDQDDVLWKIEGRKRFEAGKILDKSILIEHLISGGFNFEKFEFKGKNLVYERKSESRGYQWIYRATLGASSDLLTIDSKTPFTY